MSDIESDTGPWAAVPAWVIDADISPRAFKLYAILSLHADGGASKDGATTRTRRALAARLACSVDTLDRAVNELEAIGALQRIPQTDAVGDRSANRWRLLRVRPGSREDAATGSREDAAVKRSRPQRDPDPQEQLPGAAPPAQPKKAKAAPKAWSLDADRLARAEWEHRTEKPVCGFLALRTRVQEALDAGHSPEAVARVLPTMPAFSRNAFDFALRGKPPPQPHRPPPINTDRSGESRILTMEDL